MKGRFETDRTDELFALLGRLHPLPEGVILIGACVLPLYRFALEQKGSGLFTADLDIAIDAEMPRNDPRASAHRHFLTRVHSVLVSSNEYRLVELDPVESRFEGVAHLLEPVGDSANCMRIDLLARKPQRRGAGALRAPPLDRHFGKLIVPQRVEELSLLFVEPKQVSLPGGLAVAVPNPISFVLHKALIRAQRRGRNKYLTDAAAVLEVAQLYRGHEAELADAGPRLAARAKKTAKRVADGVGILRENFLVPNLELRKAILHMPTALPRLSEDDAIALVSGFLRAGGLA